jgi:hypothetical protein
MDKNNKNNSNAFSFNKGTYTKNLKSKVQNNHGESFNDLDQNKDFNEIK